MTDKMKWILACDIACAIGRLKESNSDKIILPDRTIKYPELFGNINPEFELHYISNMPTPTNMLCLKYTMPKDGHPRYARGILIMLPVNEFNLSTTVDILATVATVYYQKRLAEEKK